MTPAQRSALAAYVRLLPDDPRNRASEEIKEMLRNPSMRTWLETWVMPHLLYAAGQDPQYHNQREHLRTDSKWITAQ